MQGRGVHPSSRRRFLDLRDDVLGPGKCGLIHCNRPLQHLHCHRQLGFTCCREGRGQEKHTQVRSGSGQVEDPCRRGRSWSQNKTHKQANIVVGRLDRAMGSAEQRGGLKPGVDTGVAGRGKRAERSRGTDGRFLLEEGGTGTQGQRRSGAWVKGVNRDHRQDAPVSSPPASYPSQVPGHNALAR